MWVRVSVDAGWLWKQLKKKKVKLSLLLGWYWSCCSAVWCPHCCVSLFFWFVFLFCFFCFFCFFHLKEVNNSSIGSLWTESFDVKFSMFFFFIYKYVCTHTNRVMESQVFIAKLTCRVLFLFFLLFPSHMLSGIKYHSFSSLVKSKQAFLGQRSARVNVVIKETMSCFDKLCLWLVQLFFPSRGTDETFWQTPSTGSRTPKRIAHGRS